MGGEPLKKIEGRGLVLEAEIFKFWRVKAILRDMEVLIDFIAFGSNTW